MKEKTKKILKGAGFTLGAVALLTLGVAVGACSAKAGTKQQTAITTPVAKSLFQRPKKAVESDFVGVWQPITDDVINLDNPDMLGQTFNVDFLFGGEQYTAISCQNVSSLRENVSVFGKGIKKAVGGYPVGIYYQRSGQEVLAYFRTDGWYETGDITILNVDDSSVTELFLSFLQTYFVKTSSEVPDIDSEPTPLPEIKEKVVLNSSYDFRRWFGNVDPTTGAIQFKLPTGISLYSVRVGGLEWENLGNERIYNCIEFTLQPLNASNALAVSDNLAKTAESLYGDKYNEFCMLSGVYYSYQSGYDGTYTVIQDSALPSVDYRDRIYSMPMVSAQLDGTANNVNALDIRNCVIPSIYRSFGIIEDDGVIFSTNGYSSVTLRQLLGMDFSSVVNYSEGTASAFSLLTQAFGSVAGLLAVQVLPNITLGLLLFLPLIAAVIVLIIKAVKK